MRAAEGGVRRRTANPTIGFAPHPRARTGVRTARIASWSVSQITSWFVWPSASGSLGGLLQRYPMKTRIEALLIKEKAARESWRVGLLWLQPVRLERGLSPDQDEQIRRSFKSHGREPRTAVTGLREVRNAPRLRDNLRNRLADQVARHELLRPLTEQQRNRRGELFLQSNGPKAFSDPDVVESLALTPAQRQRIRLIQPPAGRFDLPFSLRTRIVRKARVWLPIERRRIGACSPLSGGASGMY
jgi:hypothetical protein